MKPPDQIKGHHGAEGHPPPPAPLRPAPAGLLQASESEKKAFASATGGTEDRKTAGDP